MPSQPCAEFQIAVSSSLHPPEMRFFGLLIALQVATFVLCAQPVDQSATLIFDAPKDTATLQMGGLLDAYNTFTYPNKRAFQHMKSITITNTGDSVVVGPRLVINSKRNWFDIASLRNEVFEGAVTPKEKALSVWQFMKNNRLHYNEPDQGKEIDDPIKLLGVYGYGVCYNISYATAFLTSRYPYTVIPYMEYSPRDRHSVKNILFDTAFYLIDPDIEVFYPGYDNSTLAMYDELAEDKYLVRRTHHYGKAFNYNSFNKYVAEAVFTPKIPKYFTGIYRDIDFHKLDFTLRPDESIRYSWDTAKYFHHNFYWTPNAPLADIGNGQLIYSTNFRNADLNMMLSGWEDITVEEDDENGLPILHPTSVNDTASFVVKVTSPFVIVNGKVKGKFHLENPDDIIKISFSKDSLTWDSLWQATATGSDLDDIVEFYDAIQPVNAKATYKYYLKFEILSTGSLQTGLDSLQIFTDFQVSRFFLPSLELGENVITYADQVDEREITVKIEWKENSDNTPPLPVENPVFPTHEASVDSLKFTFEWENASDPDGIVDYEFFLSDRPDTKFPLSPTFEIYTSAIEGGGLNSYTIPYNGLLNANTTYYWKVRPKDAQGAWGEWSPTWAFTPAGPMPPTLEESTIIEDSLVLKWRQNQSGTTPAYYEIHASNEAYGFTPSHLTLLDTAKMLEKKMPVPTDGTLKTFYRVIAVDQNGSESGASNYKSIPYPYAFSKLDSIKPQEPYTINLQTNQVHIADMYIDQMPFQDFDILDPVAVNVLSKPEWLNYDQGTETLFGTPNYAQAHPDSVILEFSGILTGATRTQVLKLPARPNTKPELSTISRLAYVDSVYSETITISDLDYPYGDFISAIEVVDAPSWVQVEPNEAVGTVVIKGKPNPVNHGDHSVTIKVSDGAEEFTEKTYSISVYANASISGDSEICFGDSTTLRVSFNGKAPWNFNIFDGTSTTQVNNIMLPYHDIVVSPENTTNFTLASVWGAANNIVIEKNVVNIDVKKYSIVGITNPEANVDNVYSSTIVVDNPCDVELEFRLVEGPEWISVDSQGVISGVPQGQAVGNSNVAVEIIGPSRNSEIATFTVNVKDVAVIIAPNPFSNEARILYQLTEVSDIQITVISMRGKVIHRTEGRKIPPGIHEEIWNPENLESGVLLVKVDVIGESGVVKSLVQKIVKR